jgi:hypothetical protein
MKRRIVIATLIGVIVWVLVISTLCSHTDCKITANNLPGVLSSMLMFIVISNALLVGFPWVVMYLSRSEYSQKPLVQTTNNSVNTQESTSVNSMRKYSNLFIFYYLVINIVVAVVLYIAGYKAPSTLIVIAIASSCLAARKYFNDFKSSPTASQIASYSKISTLYIAVIQTIVALVLVFILFGRIHGIKFLTSSESLYFYGVLLILGIAQYIAIRLSFSWYLKKLVLG